MPIRVADYRWDQNEEQVVITVPLKGARAAKADVYCNSLLVKVNFPPYLFEADLHAEVDHANSKATVGNGTVVFTLPKTVPGLWPELVAKELTKEQIAERRAKAEAAARDDAVRADEEKKKQKHEAAQHVLRQQMELEQRERQKLADAKQAEVDKANAEIEELAQTMKATPASDPSKDIFSPADISRGPAASAAAPSSSSSSSSTASSAATSAEKSAPIRKSGKITVSFTHRDFSTPSRESKLAEEEEWMRKQAEARKAVAQAKESSPGDIEHDPLWLQDRGKTFFSTGDYQSAINAFTTAITLDPNMASLYSNRAACHLKLMDAQACAMDSSKALSLLQPPVEANAKSRLRALSRRGAALALLGDLESAAADYKEALVLDPDNEGLKADIIKLEQQITAQQRQRADEELD